MSGTSIVKGLENQIILKVCGRNKMKNNYHTDQFQDQIKIVGTSITSVRIKLTL